MELPWEYLCLSTLRVGSTGEVQLMASQVRFPLWTEDWMCRGPRPFHFPKPFIAAHECLKSPSVPRLGSCHCNPHKCSIAYTVLWEKLPGHVWTFCLTRLACICRRTKRSFIELWLLMSVSFPLTKMLYSSRSCLWVCIAGFNLTNFPLWPKSSLKLKCKINVWWQILCVHLICELYSSLPL